MNKKVWLVLLLSLGVIAVCRARESRGPSGSSAAAMSVGDPLQSGDRGIGPIKELKLGPVDPKLAARGKEIFDARCASCHGRDKDGAGPALAGELKKEGPEFVMNMILNTAEMEAKNETIKKEAANFGLAMPAPGLTTDEARAVLEYLRTTGK
jgi:cytochrome c